MRLFISPDVHCTEIQGFLIALDLRTERYSIFDPVATSMLKALIATDNEDDAVGSLQAAFVVERARLETDLREFRRRCLDDGWLGETALPRKAATCREVVATGRPRAPVLTAWYHLLQTAYALSTKSLAQVHDEYARLPVIHRSFADTDKSRLLDQSLSAFSTAENFFINRRAPKDCLPRSLALFRFLRSMGLAAEHCIGVRRVPFEAHAWVEFRNQAVLDNPSRLSTFSVIVRISA